jgi:anti-sigma factor RsiW
MSINENPICDRADLVGDYAFDELAPTERRSMEQHLAQCSDCAGQLDQLRLTTAALRILPDLEVPRRIAFVSDKVFEQGWLTGFWNSAARLGFASACVLAAGLSFAAWHRQPIDQAVNKAVALAVEKTRAEDAQLTQAALDAVDSKYEQKQQNLVVAMQESMDVLRKKLDLRTTYAMWSPDVPTRGARQ